MPTITNTSSFTVTVRASKAGYKTQSTTQTVKVGGQIVIGTIKVVENSNGSGTAIAANGALTGKDLYITFSHSIASGSTSVSPSLPYKVTKNGTYTFTVTGTSNGITSKKTVSVTVNQYMSSSTGSNPYLPGNDFKKVDGTDLSNGLVIEDKDGSQYVWIEVPKTSTVYPTAGTNITNFDSAAYTKITADLENYTKAYKSGGYSDADDDAKHVMLKSVYENGGFYVGRYEAGIDTTTGTNRTSEGPTNSDGKYTIEGMPTPVTKADAYPYTYVTRTQAQNLANNVNSGNKTSSLMFGVQWDLVLAFMSKDTAKIISTDDLTSNSTKIGNYSNATFQLSQTGKYATSSYGTLSSTWNPSTTATTNFVDSSRNKLAESGGNGILVTTGTSEKNKVMNIYDIAGNVCEWTLELTSYTGIPCAVRGGDYFGVGSSGPAALRGFEDADRSDLRFGFRVSLF